MKSRNCLTRTNSFSDIFSWARKEINKINHYFDSLAGDVAQFTNNLPRRVILLALLSNHVEPYIQV
jgi:hypothetical protein